MTVPLMMQSKSYLLLASGQTLAHVVDGATFDACVVDGATYNARLSDVGGHNRTGRKEII